MKMILGPCAIEDLGHALLMAASLKKFQDYIRNQGYADFEVIYKSSYSKANRTKNSSFHGVGLAEGLHILSEVKRTTGLKVTSDVHSVKEVIKAGQILDIIQIPHQMCRNTELLQAAGKTGKTVSVKKGTFMNPRDFEHVVAKIRESGNTNEVIAIERGNHFGYGNTIVDMRNFGILNQKEDDFDSGHYNTDNSVSMCIDATHPGCGSDGAKRLAKAGVAAGADMVFLEVHNNPFSAPCDGQCMVTLAELPELVLQILKIHEVVSEKVSTR